ncbi:MAG: LytTR family DNA-binding domain-containing protein [Bacteroidales bacterium]|nr:LytTR family DNA-binding domain-containing protein [Bacteroidales bacterium]
MILKAVIIEDEQLARSIVKNYLEDESNVQLIGEYADGFSGVRAINELRPDLVFLDIQMPRLTGFEVLELIDYQPLIIFTTAYDSFAVKAFEVSACDYLMKPFSKERFNKAVAAAVEAYSSKVSKMANINKLHKTIENSGETLQRIAVRTGSKVDVISVEDITYIEAQGDYVGLHTGKDMFLKEKPMSFYEKKLDQNIFVRIHRSYILNINCIERLEYYDKENYVARLKNNKTLKISRNGYKLLKEILHL